MKYLSWLFYLTLAVICVWLAVVNRHAVTLSLSPFDVAIDLPLVFVAFLGALIAMLATGPAAALRRWRLSRRLKKADAEAARLRHDLATITAERDRLLSAAKPADAKFEAAQAGGPGGRIATGQGNG